MMRAAANPKVFPAVPQRTGAPRFRKAGAAAAHSAKPAGYRTAHPQRRPKDLQAAIFAAARESHADGNGLVWENVRLILDAIQETRDLGHSLRGRRVVDGMPRACAVARDYLNAAEDDFSEEDLTLFLEGYQESVGLE